MKAKQFYSAQRSKTSTTNVHKNVNKNVNNGLSNTLLQRKYRCTAKILDSLRQDAQLKILPVMRYCWRHRTTWTVASRCYVNIAGDGG